MAILQEIYPRLDVAMLVQNGLANHAINLLGTMGSVASMAVRPLVLKLRKGWQDPNGRTGNMANIAEKAKKD